MRSRGRRQSPFRTPLLPEEIIPLLFRRDVQAIVYDYIPWCKHVPRQRMSSLHWPYRQCPPRSPHAHHWRRLTHRGVHPLCLWLPSVNRYETTARSCVMKSKSLQRSMKKIICLFFLFAATCMASAQIQQGYVKPTVTPEEVWAMLKKITCPQTSLSLWAPDAPLWMSEEQDVVTTIFGNVSSAYFSEEKIPMRHNYSNK